MQVKYISGSKHRVIMHVGKVCVNDDLIARKLALSTGSAGACLLSIAAVYVLVGSVVLVLVTIALWSVVQSCI